MITKDTLENFITACQYIGLDEITIDDKKVSVELNDFLYKGVLLDCWDWIINNKKFTINLNNK